MDVLQQPTPSLNLDVGEWASGTVQMVNSTPALHPWIWGFIIFVVIGFTVIGVAWFMRMLRGN